MDDDQRRAAGMAIRRTVLGEAHVDRAVATTTPLTAEFQDLITRYAWGEIWTRPGLDLRDRRVLVIGTMIALGRWEELRMHVRAALAAGALTRRRAQGDRAAAGDLLRRAGGAPCAGRVVGRGGRDPAGPLIAVAMPHYATDDGCRIAYALSGPEPAPPLVLSNALGTDRGLWAAQIDALSRHHRVLATTPVATARRTCRRASPRWRVSAATSCR